MENSKNVYVTGSTGFLGLNIVEQLLISGYTVYALYRSKRKIFELNSIAQRLGKQDQLHLVKGDITNYKSLIKTIPDQCIYLFHVAAAVEANNSGAGKLQYEINVNGTANIIEACFERRVKRLIHTSTISTFKFDGTTIINEETPKNNLPNMDYPRTKRIAEFYVQDAIRRGLDAIIVSPGFIIGRYDEHSIGSIILMISHDNSSPLKCGIGKSNFCSAEEVARAHITAAQTSPVGEEYVIGGYSYTWKELYEQILFQLSIEKPVVTVGFIRFLLTGYKNDLFVKWFGRNKLLSESAVKPISSDASDQLVDDDINVMKTTTNAISKSQPRTSPYLSFVISIFQSVDVVIDCSKATNKLNYKPQTLEYMINDNIKWLKLRNLL